jgi:hypothetical protein
MEIKREVKDEEQGWRMEEEDGGGRGEIIEGG